MATAAARVFFLFFVAMATMFVMATVFVFVVTAIVVAVFVFTTTIVAIVITTTFLSPLVHKSVVMPVVMAASCVSDENNKEYFMTSCILRMRPFISNVS